MNNGRVFVMKHGIPLIISLYACILFITTWNVTFADVLFQNSKDRMVSGKTKRAFEVYHWEITG